MEKQPNQLKWGERIAFIGGEFYGGGAVPILSGIYFTFLISVVNIAPAIAGIIVLLSKVWDAITDPLMGVISDNTRTKIGRRRPYLFLGAGLVIFGMLMLFSPGFLSNEHIANPNDPLKIAIALVTYLAYSTISTIYNVPYVSLTSEFSTNQEERTTVNAIRIIVAMISGGVCFMFPTMIYNMCDHTATGGVFETTKFYWLICIIFGLYFAIPMLCVALFTKERVPYNKEEKVKFSFKQFFQPLKVKAFAMLMVMYVFSFACMDIIASQLIVFVKNILPDVNATLVYVALMATGGVCMPILRILMAKGVSKNTVFKFGIPFYLTGVLGMAFYPTNWIPGCVYIFAAIAGIGFGCVQMIPWLIFPDLCDVGELKIKQPNAGAFSGIMTFMRKVASGLGVFCVGIGLQAVNFDANAKPADQPPQAILALRLIMAISAGTFLTLAFLAAMAMKLTNKMSADVHELLAIQREHGNLDEHPELLTEEQKANYEVIKKQLF